MLGLVVSGPVYTSDYLALPRQYHEADMRVEPFKIGSHSVAHFRSAPRSKAHTFNTARVSLEQVEALRPMWSGERRSVLPKIFIDAMTPFLASPY
jgi:hypothetical protein